MPLSRIQTDALQSAITSGNILDGAIQTVDVSSSASGLVQNSFRNKIINGDMRIDQRNAGVSVTPSAIGYTLDRWRASFDQASKFSVQQTPSATETGYAVRVAAGFSTYMAITSTSSYTVGANEQFSIGQRIEGLNVSDLAWGTADAKTVTLSFLVRSSLTGTFSGALQNSAQTRSYPFTYTISAANTWEQKSITIVGETTGTWLTTNGVGINLSFCIGGNGTALGAANAWRSADNKGATGTTNVVSTSGATFYITGVQLEKGVTATPFETRHYGTELALCQRYYQRITLTANPEFWGTGYWNSTTGVQIYTPFVTTMRAAPTALETSGVPGQYSVRYVGGRDALSAGPTFASATTSGISISGTSSLPRTAGDGSIGTVEAATFLAWSSEL